MQQVLPFEERVNLSKDTPIDTWWDTKVNEVGLGELVGRGDELARFARKLLEENHKLNLLLLDNPQKDT